jgi:hypothetical protein
LIILKENLKLFALLGKTIALFHFYLHRPSCQESDMLEKMIDAGMDIARFNCNADLRVSYSNSIHILCIDSSRKLRKSQIGIRKKKGQKCCSYG